ncbi:serine/threonine-protein phosphatase 7 isoform X2 [Populus trichocarpa]|nr:serine/threonine-protein phosphatase 7 isoform X2 [Populus trichocarpa]|eukprot:XP_002300541.3 serine/threonine-protein phosphatase 7 isoform X2 [Populus trichocarpa]
MSDSLPSGSPSDHEPATTATNSPEEATTTSSTTTTTSTPEGPSPPPIQIPLSWPSNSSVTLDWIQNLISAFDWSSKNLPPSELPSVLPVSVFDALVLTASKILHKEPNCVRIDDCNENSRVVVVGDVHGQLHDVMFLLQDAGFPFEDRFFVFNGDYVDRGAWGLETFLLLLAWKVFLPQRVFLLRGNHESKYCTSVYGFEKEVLAKYGDKGKHVYRKCLGCFEGLPLASVIAGRVYTAHGGLFRSVSITPSKRSKGKKNRRIILNSETKPLCLGSLEELSKARRSVLDPPWEGQNLIPGDVLWSDPTMKSGLSPNTERGIGLLWGPDCTEDFLKKFELKLIIRSHEGPDAREKRPGLGGMDEGYTIDHVVPSGKLITLFSAPDYPQFQATEDRYKNKGAYIVLKPPCFDDPEFHSFEAITPRPAV